MRLNDEICSGSDDVGSNRVLNSESTLYISLLSSFLQRRLFVSK
jgi:hypothetical protein